MKICYLFLTIVSLLMKMLLSVKFQRNKKFSWPCLKWVLPKLQVLMVSLHCSTKNIGILSKMRFSPAYGIFYGQNNLLKEQNHWFIAFVPKKLGASSVHQFHPISLCNVIYKIISKILANRFKGLLRHFISPFQYAFVPFINIQDNSILVHELFNSINLKRGRGGLMQLKLIWRKLLTVWNGVLFSPFYQSWGLLQCGLIGFVSTSRRHHFPFLSMVILLVFFAQSVV
jgi:hypothetical protein